jgi:hypothetical protein
MLFRYVRMCWLTWVKDTKGFYFSCGVVRGVSPGDVSDAFSTVRNPPGKRGDSTNLFSRSSPDTLHATTHRSFALFGLLQPFVASGSVWAYEHAAALGGGGPCPFQGSGAETKQHSFRALAERTGDGGIPEGGYQAVMTDLKNLMTDSQDYWPGDFAGTPHGPHYGGCVLSHVLPTTEMHCQSNRFVSRAIVFLSPNLQTC